MVLRHVGTLEEGRRGSALSFLFYTSQLISIDKGIPISKFDQ
jgi:hypothetical protein